MFYLSCHLDSSQTSTKRNLRPDEFLTFFWIHLDLTQKELSSLGQIRVWILDLSSMTALFKWLVVWLGLVLLCFETWRGLILNAIRLDLDFNTWPSPVYDAKNCLGQALSGTRLERLKIWLGQISEDLRLDLWWDLTWTCLDSWLGLVWRALTLDCHRWLEIWLVVELLLW